MLQPVSLRRGEKQHAFLSMWRERDGGRPFAGSKPIHKMLSICNGEASMHAQRDIQKQQIISPAFTNARLQPGSRAVSAPLYNGPDFRASSRGPAGAPGASPITCRNAPRALCASGKE